MPRYAYRELSLNIPDDWQDSSILSWMTPAPPQIQTMRVKEPRSEQPNVVLTRRDIAEQADLETFAKGQEQVMAGLMPQLKVLDRSARELPDPFGEALIREFSFSDQRGILRQVQAYFQSSGSFYIFAATASDDLNFSALREQALQILDSLRAI